LHPHRLQARGAGQRHQREQALQLREQVDAAAPHPRPPRAQQREVQRAGLAPLQHGLAAALLRR
jgi:hypothetical protein